MDVSATYIDLVHNNNITYPTPSSISSVLGRWLICSALSKYHKIVLKAESGQPRGGGGPWELYPGLKIILQCFDIEKAEVFFFDNILMRTYIIESKVPCLGVFALRTRFRVQLARDGRGRFISVLNGWFSIDLGKKGPACSIPFRKFELVLKITILGVDALY